MVSSGLRHNIRLATIWQGFLQTVNICNPSRSAGSCLRAGKVPGVSCRLWVVTFAAANLLFGPAAWAKGQTYALVVGIDDYVRPSIPKLRYAVSDAKLFAQALRDTMKVPAENLFLMTSDSVDENSLPRVVNVAYRLGWLSEKVHKEDTIIFYFAGHGMTVDGQPFLLTEEADNRSSSTLKVSALNGGEVTGTLRKPGVANVWVVLDACRNSPGSKGEVQLDATLTGSFSHADVGREHSATMFACKVGERSWELDDVKHGCYTYFLVDGLRRQAAEANGMVTLQGLSNYVGREVPKATEKFGWPQTPTLFYGGGSSDQWVLAQVTPPTPVAHSKQESHEMAEYAAKLDVLQAKLDRETALRVAAEQKALAEESKRRELEQRLAVMEKQIRPQAGLTAPQSQPQMMAYADRGFHDDQRTQAMEQEIQRLRTENENLSKRLSSLQVNVAKVGMVSRDVLLLDQVEQTQARESQLLSSQATEPQAQLELCLRVRQTQGQLLVLLEQAYGSALSQRKLPPDVATEVDFLKQRIEIQKQETSTSELNLAAAGDALKEANQRLAEAQAREQKYHAIIHQLTAQLQDSERQLAQIREQLDQTQQQLESKTRELRESQEKSREMEMATDKKFEGTAIGKNMWKFTRRAYFFDLTVTRPPEAGSFYDIP